MNSLPRVRFSSPETDMDAGDSAAYDAKGTGFHKGMTDSESSVPATHGKRYLVEL